MFKTLNPNDVSIKSFKVYKSFNFTQADSGSSVFGLEGISGSLYAFELSSSPSRSFTKDTAPYSQSFYSEPLYYEIKRLYYTTSDQPFNSFGGNNTKTNLQMINEIVAIIGDKKLNKLIKFTKDRLGHDLRYSISVSDNLKKLGWKKTISLKQGLKKTIEWQRRNQKK